VKVGKYPEAFVNCVPQCPAENLQQLSPALKFMGLIHKALLLRVLNITKAVICQPPNNSLGVHTRNS
jgi:hypothetical protein